MTGSTVTLCPWDPDRGHATRNIIIADEALAFFSLDPQELG